MQIEPVRQKEKSNTNPLKGELGYIKKSAKEVGVELEPAKKGGAFAEFECAGTLGTVVGVGSKKTGAEYTSSGCNGSCPGTTPTEEAHGGYDGIISPITPVDQMTANTSRCTRRNPNTPTETSRATSKKSTSDVLEDYIYLVSEPIAPDGLVAGR